MDQLENNAVTVTETEIVKLHLGLKLLNGSLEELSKANAFNKVSKAERVVSDMRDLIALQTFAVHALFNEVKRTNCVLIDVSSNLNRINEIGVIKNG